MMEQELLLAFFLNQLTASLQWKAITCRSFRCCREMLLCAVLSSSATPITADPSTVDALDLQVEYWTVAPRTELAVEKVERSSRKEMKCSLKMSLHSLRVFRSPAVVSTTVTSSAADPASLLTMVIVMPEKKQKSTYRCSSIVIIGVVGLKYRIFVILF